MQYIDSKMCNPTRGMAGSSSGGENSQRQTSPCEKTSRFYKNMVNNAKNNDGEDSEHERLVTGGSTHGSDKYHHPNSAIHANLVASKCSDRMRNVLAVCLISAACFLAGATYGQHNERASSSTAAHLLRSSSIGGKSLVKKTNSGGGGAKPGNRFVVVSQQRSGSRFLTSMLDSHKTIRCGNEELLQWTKDIGGGEKDLEGKKVDDYYHQVDMVMDQLPSQATPHSPVGSPLTHVGFKIMYDQGILHYGEDLLQRLDENNVKIIHLVRKNKLLQYVSKDSNNKDKGVEGHNPHPTTEAEAAQLRTVTVDGKVKKIIKFLREKAGETKAATDLLDAHYGPGGYLSLYYEDLDQDNQGEMSRIFNFLGVEDEKVQSEYTKIHEGQRTREYFAEEDRDEVEAAIRESRFEYMLQPDPPSYLGW